MAQVSLPRVGSRFSSRTRERDRSILFSFTERPPFQVDLSLRAGSTGVSLLLFTVLLGRGPSDAYPVDQKFGTGTYLLPSL